MYKYYKLHKPFGYLSQFTQEVEGQKTLADLLEVEKDVYPIGRLDKDSEGLLLLTNNRSITQSILHPKFAHEREYWVQLEGEITDNAIQKLLDGVTYRSKKKEYYSKAIDIRRMAIAPLPARIPPIRERQNIPTSWISMKLTEGKHRQLRKMCAKVNFPVLRLIRYAIQNITIDGLDSGDYYSMNEKLFLNQLGLSN